MRKTIIYVLMWVFSTPVHANCVVDGVLPDLPEFVSQEKYSIVRHKLISADWLPYRAPDALPCMDGDKRCKDRPEMLACSGVGLAPCAWVWRKENHFIVIGTIYEVDDERFTGVDVYHECG